MFYFYFLFSLSRVRILFAVLFVVWRIITITAQELLYNALSQFSIGFIIRCYIPSLCTIQSILHFLIRIHIDAIFFLLRDIFIIIFVRCAARCSIRLIFSVFALLFFFFRAVFFVARHGHIDLRTISESWTFLMWKPFFSGFSRVFYRKFWQKIRADRVQFTESIRSERSKKQWHFVVWFLFFAPPNYLRTTNFAQTEINDGIDCSLVFI